MKPADEREEIILREALKRARGPERETFLDGACLGNQPLREKLERLLKAEETPGSRPQPPTEPGTVTVALPPEEGPGMVIGRYKLLEKVGEGGCGVVYVAEQTEPVRRRVALKVIKLGMETKQVVARFEAERQALAMMDHPNIAKVLDAGATDIGRPYFVMELVKGIPITTYCDQEKLATRERLDLFVQVCHAIQHAHQKGIIHRDIKPSNILVALHDGVPVPKVIDFGIAKATQQELTDKTVYTQLQQFIGTPAYMSPEQAEMSGLDIDTCSDIYSLGVLLYELLTGSTPFDAKELSRSGLDEMRKIIREREPMRPSTRLRQTTSLRVSPSELSTLNSRLSTDLDWIVMKCLEKDRTRRYETANALAMDVERHLNSEPVSARPPSRVYRFQKLVRRNKLAFAAGTAVLGALLIGLGLSTWLLFRERAAHARVLAVEKVQSQLRQQAQVEAQFFKSMLGDVGPAFAQGRDTTMLKEILDKAAERVSRDLKGQPEVGAELQSTLGEAYSAFGQYSKAEELHRAALAQRKALFGNMNTNVADSLDQVGRAALEQCRIAEAERFVLEALAIRTNLLGSEHIERAASLFHLGEVRYWQGRLTEAEGLARQSLAMRRKLLGNNHPDVAESLALLSGVLVDSGRADQAEPFAREALAIQARLASGEERAALFKGSLGFVLFVEGKLDQAETQMRRELALRRKVLGMEHPATANYLRGLALVLLAESRLDEAEGAAREGVAVSRKTLGDQHYITAWCLGTLAQTLRKAGRLSEAEAAYREALALYHKERANTMVAFPQSFTPSGLHEGENNAVMTAYTFTCISLAQLLQEQGKLAEAEALYRETVEAGRKVNNPADLADALAGLGDLLRDQGKMAQAESACREGLDLCRKFSPNASERRQWLAVGLAQALKSEGKLAEAEGYYRESVANAAKAWPNDPARWQWQVSELVDVLGSQGKFSEADKLLAELSPTASLVQTPSAGALRIRADFSGRHGRWKDAAAGLKKLLEVDPSNAHDHLELAAVLVRTSDLESYQRQCRSILARFSTTNDPSVLDQAAKACLLTPEAVTNLETVSQMAAQALTLGRGNQWFSFFQMDNGLAQYRRGEYAGAVDSLRTVIGQPLNVGRLLPAAERDTAAWSVLAMAQHQLKRESEAQAALTNALELAHAKLPQLDSADLGQDWSDWLIAHILLREAEALVTGKRPAPAQEGAE